MCEVGKGWILSKDFDVIVLIPLRCIQQRTLEEIIIEYTEEKIFIGNSTNQQVAGV